MQKVITINLNGNAYQLDDAGYHALVAYLDGAGERLRDNPDRAEILADLEQAIAEKCLRYLGPQKTVVTAIEVDHILHEMGPVEGAPGEHAGGAGSGPDAGDGAREAGAGPRGGAPRRLYLVKEGAMIAGVCSGISAYLNVDPTIIRIIFVGMTILSKGFFVLAYIVLAVVIPKATTREEQAAAQGRPFNTQEIIDHAMRQISDFRDKSWKRRWRRQRRQWKRQMRWYAATPMPPGGPVGPGGYVARIFAGILIPVLSFVNAALFWGLVLGIVGLFAYGEPVREVLPPDVPIWVVVFVIVMVYVGIAAPIGAARRAAYVAVGGYHHAMVAALDGIMSVGFAALILWVGYENVPEVRSLVDAIPGIWDALSHAR